MLKVISLIYSWAHGPTLHYDLEVAPGEIVVLRGPSGAGKSTLLSLIAGFITPSAGDITWHGESLLDLQPDRRPVTSLFQSGNLFEHLDAFTNVALGLHPGARLDAGQAQRVVETFASLGLAGLERRLPGALSGGQQQRVALARVLVRARPVLLLDEPFTALDPDTRHDILALVHKLVTANSLATIAGTAFCLTAARLGSMRPSRRLPDDVAAVPGKVNRWRQLRIVIGELCEVLGEAALGTEENRALQQLCLQ